MVIDKDEAAAVFTILRKIWPHAKMTLEQEKRFRPVIQKAATHEAALDILQAMYEGGVQFPTPYDFESYRKAALRAVQAEFLEAPGPYITFRDWYELQDPEMQARVRKVFPSLKIFAERNDP